MAGLARNQTNTIELINWFLTVGGVLTDAYSMEFRIFDITGGLPGTQIFPTPPNYEDVTSAPGKFSTGAYYAYDNTEGQGFTPEVTANIGTHRIEWRWKISSGATYQAGYEDFEVLIIPVGGPSETYILVQDIRDEGLLEADYSDALVLSYIEIWQEFLDRACRQWFNPRAMTLYLDGTDSDLIQLGVPIISIEYIKINESTTELNTDYYKVYNNQGWPDDRRNPRIKLVNEGNNRDIFSGPGSDVSLIFRKGRQNQEIKGIFGFTEANGYAPKMIKRALTKLVIEKLTTPIYRAAGGGGAIPSIIGSVVEEWTDSHKIKYSNPGGETKPRAPGLLGITNDPEILNIIKLYKGPLAMGSPADWSYK